MRRPERAFTPRLQRGVTLVEVIVFIVVINLAFVAVMQIYGQAVVNSVDPVVRVRATELARATLDEILARRFDENSPSGGIPACGTAEGEACLGIGADTDYDDVGDFNGYSDATHPNYPVAVSVVNAGGDLGLAPAMARKITVVVGMPDGNQVTLAAYKANY
ncbi:MAG TPA: type II secretion system protein [Marinagarivorans sp.]